MQKPQAHVRVDLSAGCSIGPGKIALLEGIARTGSLSAAARSLGMSYRRAWLLLHSVNEAFQEPVAELSVGGKDGGGARLTAFGQELVSTYRDFETAVDALAVRSFSGVRPNPGGLEGASEARRPLRRSLADPATRKREA